MVSESEIASVKSIVELLRSRPALTKQEIETRFSRYFKNAFGKMLDDGQTYGQATRAPGTAIKTTNEAEFRAHLKATDNNLAEQSRIVAEGVRHYFENGENPAPYYAWRVAIILRKEKLYALEADFLEAFSEKFPATIGGKYKDIAERAHTARKLSEAG